MKLSSNSPTSKMRTPSLSVTSETSSSHSSPHTESCLATSFLSRETYHVNICHMLETLSRGGIYQFDAPHEGLFHLDELGQSFCQFGRKCSCCSLAEIESNRSSAKESTTFRRRLRRGRRLNLRRSRCPRLAERVRTMHLRGRHYQPVGQLTMSLRSFERVSQRQEDWDQETTGSWLSEQG